MPDNKFKFGKFLSQIAQGVERGSWNPGGALTYLFDPQAREEQELASNIRRQQGQSMLSLLPEETKTKLAQLGLEQMRATALKDVVGPAARQSIAQADLGTATANEGVQDIQDMREAWKNSGQTRGGFTVNEQLRQSNAQSRLTDSQLAHLGVTTEGGQLQNDLLRRRAPITIDGQSFDLPTSEAASLLLQQQHYGNILKSKEKAQANDFLARVLGIGSVSDYTNPEWANIGLRHANLPPMPAKVDPNEARLKAVRDAIEAQKAKKGQSTGKSFLKDAYNFINENIPIGSTFSAAQRAGGALKKIMPGLPSFSEMGQVEQGVQQQNQAGVQQYLDKLLTRPAQAPQPSPQVPRFNPNAALQSMTTMSLDKIVQRDPATIKQLTDLAQSLGLAPDPNSLQPHMDLFRRVLETLQNQQR